MGGNASYAGYVRTMALNDDVDYDLAIICYGQNDSADGFSTSYESIIQAIRSKYPGCSIISILESSQQTYTEKMTTIQSICEHCVQYERPGRWFQRNVLQLGVKKQEQSKKKPCELSHGSCSKFAHRYEVSSRQRSMNG